MHGWDGVQLWTAKLLLLSNEKEFDRSIGDVLKRDDEKLGMPNSQHGQVISQ